MMRNKIILTIVVSCLCLAAVVAGVVRADLGDNIHFLAGEYFGSAKSEAGINSISGDQLVASYNGHDITAAMVEYQRNMNVMRDESTAKKYDTDINIINRLIEKIIAREEAERLGFSATEDEINQMVNGAVSAYSLAEGKASLDAFCQGAGITFDEYLELLRQQAPGVIAIQKLKDAIGKQYCAENGLEYTKVNPPEGMLAAQEAYIAELFDEHSADITYYIETQ